VRRQSHPALDPWNPGARRSCSLRLAARFGFENAGSPRFRSAPWKFRPEDVTCGWQGLWGKCNVGGLCRAPFPQTKKPPTRTTGPAARHLFLSARCTASAHIRRPDRPRRKPRGGGRCETRNGGWGRRSLRINITCLKALVQPPRSARRDLEPLRHGTPGAARLWRREGRWSARFRALPCHTFSSS